jgi:hypothetical protein
MSSDELVGFWSAIGEEVRLINDRTTIEVVNLRLEKQISKTVISDVYLVKEIFYYLDGSVNYGPTSYLINTDGKNEFVCADEYPTGTGIDKYIISNDGQLKYSYNVDGINDGTKWIALVGEYILKKDSKPLYQSVSTTKGTLTLKDGSVIIETATASATGYDASDVEEDSKTKSVDTVIKLLNSLISGRYQGAVITDTHTDSVVTLLH